MDTGQVLAWGRQMLFGKSEYPARDAAVLLSHVLQCSTAGLYLHPDKPVTSGQFGIYSSLVARRALKEPIAYITGHKEFMGLKFKVDKRVLIPRPETEVLVETSLSIVGRMVHEIRTGPVVVCDVCCGSGAVGLSILKLLPQPSARANQRRQAEPPGIKVILTDISPDALDVAKENAKSLGVFPQVEFLLGDGLEPIKQHGFANKVDLIASNPPYIPRGVIASLDEEVRCYEPHLALDGGCRGMDFIETLIGQAPSVLAPGGFLVMEIGHDQADRCQEIFSALAQPNHVDSRGGRCASPWHKWQFVQDYAGRQRVLAARVNPGRPACTRNT
ncbi:MAG TPA: peptide chain release factor N(5)-glutamine methyltransferase [Firmicutes bacterium]|nr:peptide chain release factor N(5)-glutamine methyltransferase [Candidatus Fermentithermobacillaceae bacterium]